MHMCAFFANIVKNTMQAGIYVQKDTYLYIPKIHWYELLQKKPAHQTICFFDCWHNTGSGEMNDMRLICWTV